MSRTHAACLVCVALAVALGAYLGGQVGLGMLGGALLGGGIGLVAHGLMQRSLAGDLEASLRALLAAFGLKVVVLVLAWAAVRYVPALHGSVDASAFLLAYVAMAVLLLGVGSFDHLRTLQARAVHVGGHPAAPHDTGDSHS